MPSSLLRLSLGFLSFVLLFSLLSLPFFPYAAESAAEDADAQPLPFRTVVIDAGHGGEDGGAVSENGLIEKELNLTLAFLLRELFEANGTRVILTRSEDILLYDRNADYEGQKKRLDLAAREEIARAHPDALFLSIHMNTHPLPQCSGLQVWYSKNDPRSEEVAQAIQTYTRSLLQPDNTRSPKASGSSIYLLHRLQTPAVLVECGFLSSPSESALLADGAYLKKLALTLFLSLTKAGFL